MTSPNTIFADGILDASVNHGVARLTLAQQGADGKPVAAGQLILPLAQLPHFANGLMALIKQIEGRMKEAQAAAPATPSSEPDLAAVPGAFRFG